MLGLNFIPVESKLIEGIAYDSKVNKLYVKFQPKFVKSRQRTESPIYVYRNLPASEVDQLLQAESIGGYFIANIRNAYKDNAKRLTSVIV